MHSTLSQTRALLTREEAADYLGVLPQTLAAWATTGRYELPYIRVGKSVRYRLADLEAWLVSRTVRPGASQE